MSKVTIEVHSFNFKLLTPRNVPNNLEKITMERFLDRTGIKFMYDYI